MTLTLANLITVKRENLHILDISTTTYLSLLVKVVCESPLIVFTFLFIARRLINISSAQYSIEFHSMRRIPHGQRTLNEPFFIEIQNFLALADKLADKFLGILGICGPTISTHFCTVSPLSMFSIIQPVFLQKTKPLYPNPKYLFGIGIWIWAAKN